VRPATAPRSRGQPDRLLRVWPDGRFADTRIADLPRLVRAGDLLVVNDAATLPASLAGRAPSGLRLELRLARRLDERHWLAVLFGDGDWRTPTEKRSPPPQLQPGERITLSPALSATVIDCSPLSPRLVRLCFDREGASLWAELYRLGRPIQYAYLEAPLHLWAVQNVYAARPWALELPSAGRPLDWELLLALKRRGVALAALTHAAGISSTGDAALDAALPLPERYELPAETARLVNTTRAAGGRVIAVGTSVVRALESAAAAGGAVAAGAGETELLIGPGYSLRVVGGLLTGLHEPTASHFALLQAFVPRRALEAAYRFAERAGYRCHEFGDSSLLLPD
jgi:S-adenosylmethionine:tRNA ribosyltransferase-isomerase